jgi:hypothetical protein
MDPSMPGTVTNPTMATPGVGASEMPSVYIQPEVATTGTVQDANEVFDCGFTRNIDGVLKAIEMVFEISVDKNYL